MPTVPLRRIPILATTVQEELEKEMLEAGAPCAASIQVRWGRGLCWGHRAGLSVEPSAYPVGAGGHHHVRLFSCPRSATAPCCCPCSAPSWV